MKIFQCVMIICISGISTVGIADPDPSWRDSIGQLRKDLQKAKTEEARQLLHKTFSEKYGIEVEITERSEAENRAAVAEFRRLQAEQSAEKRSDKKYKYMEHKDGKLVYEHDGLVPVARAVPTTNMLSPELVRQMQAIHPGPVYGSEITPEIVREALDYSEGDETKFKNYLKDKAGK